MHAAKVQKQQHTQFCNFVQYVYNKEGDAIIATKARTLDRTFC